jgi:soluble cytochrome b562
MKCFEQHHVRRLSQIDNEQDNSIKKCLIHSDYSMNYFCQTCSQNLCEQCLILHPTSQHQIEKNQFELIREDFHEKLNQIDQKRLNSLANLDHQLTSFQHDYDKTRTQIDLAHTQYQQALNQVYKECLSSLSNLQREEELCLLEKLEKVQKGSQSFDDSRLVIEQCLEKCSLNELIQLKTKLFDEKFHLFEDLFHIESTNDEQHNNDFVQFLSTPIQDFQQIIKLHFGQIRKSQLKSSPINNHYQRGSLLSTTNGDSVSSSSGVGSIGIGQTSSSGRILSNGVSPSGTNREDYYPTNEVEPVVENLRALESIFADSLSTVHPNVQINASNESTT